MKPYSNLIMLLSLIFAVSCSDKVAEQPAPAPKPVVAKVEVAKPIIPTVTTEEQESYKKRIIEAAKPKLEELAGEAFFVGFKARRQGFTSAQRVELETVKLGAFKCKYFDPQGEKEAAELTDVWCHFLSDFQFKDETETTKNYQDLLKVRIDKEGQPVLESGKLFTDSLASAFVTKNPLANNGEFEKHFPNLKVGKLAIGMPEEFLRVVWGNPKHVVDFELNEAGRRETFVYRDYFVVLRNRIVKSVHRFNDVKPADPTAGL